MKSREKSELLGLKTFGLLGFLLFSALIIGCNPSISTRTATLSSCSNFPSQPSPDFDPSTRGFSNSSSHRFNTNQTGDQIQLLGNRP